MGVDLRAAGSSPVPAQQAGSSGLVSRGSPRSVPWTPFDRHSCQAASGNIDGKGAPSIMHAQCQHSQRASGPLLTSRESSFVSSTSYEVLASQTAGAPLQTRMPGNHPKRPCRPLAVELAAPARDTGPPSETPSPDLIETATLAGMHRRFRRGGKGHSSTCHSYLELGYDLHGDRRHAAIAPNVSSGATFLQPRAEDGSLIGVFDLTRSFRSVTKRS